MQDGETLVFVEVRQRSSAAFGGALASIDHIKLTKLTRSAQHYLAVHYVDQPPPCRFDVVAIEGNQLHWLDNIEIQNE